MAGLQVQGETEQQRGSGLPGQARGRGGPGRRLAAGQHLQVGRRGRAGDAGEL